MKRQHDSNRRRDSDGAVLGFRGFQRHDSVAPDDRYISALATFARKIGEDRARLPYQPHMMDVSASEMEAFDPEPVVLGRFVLFDIAARFERGEQAEDVIFVQLEPFGKFGYAKFIDLAEELLEHVEGMRNRLDEVVGFIASDHSQFWCPAFVLRLAPTHFGKVF